MTLQMNYAIVIMAAVFVISLTYWYIAGHKHYTGPRTNTHVVDGGGLVDAPSDSDLKDREKAVTVG